MAKVVKSKTYDSEYAARAREGGSNTLWIVRKDVFTRARLALHDAPCFGSELEVSVVPELRARMFSITNNPAARRGIKIGPFKSTYLRLPSG